MKNYQFFNSETCYKFVVFLVQFLPSDHFDAINPQNLSLETSI